MPSGKPTLRDVAKAAGVSPMTASNALHGKPGVKDSTRAKVLAVAEKLDYRINLTASMLKSGRSNIIHIIVNEFDSPFYSKLVESLVTETTERGLTPFVEQTRYSPDAAKHALANNPFSGQLFDGEIIHASGLNAGVPLSAINHGRPLVLIDACEETPTFDTVNFPNEDGARAAVQHLIECGCHRIAIVGDGYSPRTELAHVESSSGLRLRGASGALLDAGLPYDESTNFIGYGSDSFLRHQVNLFHLAYFHISDSGIEAGHAIAEAMLEARAQSADDTAESRSSDATRATGSTPAIDGIFCINDYAAFGVIRGLADYGIRVPDDVRVIGFDGATAGSYTTPTLSTVQVDLDQLAQFALDMITRRVEQRDQGDGRSDESAGMPATRATIGYTLVPRESTVGSANR